MSVLKCASSPGSNPYVTYMKEKLLPSTKHTLTEFLINRFCQLILPSHRTFFNSVKLEFQYRKIGAKRTFQQGMGVSSAFSSAQ